MSVDVDWEYEDITLERVCFLNLEQVLPGHMPRPRTAITNIRPGLNPNPNLSNSKP